MKKVLLCLFCMMFFLQGCGKDHEGEPIELTPQGSFSQTAGSEKEFLHAVYHLG